MPAAAACLLWNVPAAAQDRSGRSAVFTTAQASRGQEKYQAYCAFCHPVTVLPPDAHVDGWTGGSIVGERFLKRFDTAFALFDLISRTMPANDPGGLGRQSYVDLVAFILQANDFQPGAVELPKDADGLKQIRIDPADR